MGDAAIPVLPDFTTQSAAVYKANIDAGFAVADRSGWAFAPHEQTVPSMVVVVAQGAVFDGTTLTEKSAQTTGTITAPTTDPRIDRIVVDRTTGVISVITGSEAASPTPPAITAGKAPIAQIALVVSQTSIVNADITDERALNTLGIEVSTTDAFARANVKVNSLRIAALEDDAFNNQLDGIADAYTDESGVDTGASTNEVYDAAGDFYANFTAVALGNFAQAHFTDGAFGDGVAGKKYVGLKFTNTNASLLQNVKVEITLVNTAFNCHAEVWTDSAGSPGSQVGADSATVNLSSVQEETFTFATPPTLAASTDYWIVLVDEGTTGDVWLSHRSGGSLGTGYHDTLTSITDDLTEKLRMEVNVNDNIADFTLISTAFTAEADPTSIEVLILHEPISAVTIGTDFTHEVSRDGGTTYGTVTLTDEGEFSTGINILRGTGDVSGQPAGSSVKYRAKTLNTKEQRLHGMALAWS